MRPEASFAFGVHRARTPAVSERLSKGELSGSSRTSNWQGDTVALTLDEHVPEPEPSVRFGRPHFVWDW